MWKIEEINVLEQNGNETTYKILNNHNFSNKIKCEEFLKETPFSNPIIITHYSRKFKMRYIWDKETQKLEVRGFLGESTAYGGITKCQN